VDLEIDRTVDAGTAVSEHAAGGCAAGAGAGAGIALLAVSLAASRPGRRRRSR
jgi:hypothetical protein